VGFFDWFRRGRRTGSADPTAAAPLPQTWAPSLAGPGPSGGAGFAVIDVETTGLSPMGHRILELAIVRTDEAGVITDEWSTRFNPEGPVGATHIHGINDADVRGAPLFPHLIPEVTRRLTGAAVAGHNVAFDLGFLRAEYARAGWALPRLPAACTLEHSHDHLPHLTRRRLVDCCAAIGLPLQHSHSALHDARATANLLAAYLDAGWGQPPRAGLLSLPAAGRAVVWPTAPSGVEDLPVLRAPRAQQRIDAWKTTPPALPLVPLVGEVDLADALDDGAPEGSLSYLELLAEVLEDGVLTEEERAALTDVATLYELDDSAVAAAHRGFLLALAHRALDDGRVTRQEKSELQSMAGLLDVPVSVVATVLDRAEAARHARLSAGLLPLPDSWEHGEPLRVGDKVAFTGREWLIREDLEQRAAQLGVRVMGNVSSRTAMLVTDGGFSGGKAEDAAVHGTRHVHPVTFRVLPNHLQPARPRPATSPPAGSPAARSPRSSPAAKSPAPAAPAVIRAWARANGYEVADRGRLQSDVIHAFNAAHPAPADHQSH
jgi:DNA polymerase-3 subunit epsilon